MNIEFSESISETLDILNHMGKNYTERIPKKLIDFLEKNKLDDYVSGLDHSKRLKEMNLKENTKDILAAIYIDYWCTPEQREVYKKVLIENERKHQEELKEKHNIDNVFKEKTQIIVEQEESKEEKSLVLKKESFLKRLIKKIKEILKK